MRPLSVPAVAIAALVLYVSLFHFFVFCRRRREREHLWFSLCCLIIGVYDIFCALLYSASSLPEGVRWQRAQLIAGALSAAPFLLFVAEYMQVESRRMLYTFASLLTAVALFAVVGPKAWLLNEAAPLIKTLQLPLGMRAVYYEAAPGPLATGQMLIALVAFGYVWWLAANYFHRGHRRRTVPLLLGLGLFFAGVVNDTAVASGLYVFPYTMEYAFFGLVLCMAFSLADSVVEAAAVRGALVRSESQLKAITENAPTVIYVKDIQGRYVLVNPHFEKLFDVRGTEIVGKTDHQVFPAALADKFRQDDTRVLRSREPSQFDQTAEHRYGEAVYIWTKFPLLGDDGRPLAVCGMGTDITRRKRTEEALRQSEAKYRTIIESIEEGYFEVDLEQRLSFFNDALCRILRRSAAELRGSGLRRVVDGDGAVRLEAFFAEVAAGGTPGTLAVNVRRGDGSVAAHEWSATPMHDHAGNIIGFRGMARDVSERQQAQAEKAQLEERLRQAQKMEAIGALAGGTAHDFNNLLMGIQGYASLMLLDLDGEHPHFAQLRAIEAQVDKGVELSRQLLGFAQGGNYEVAVLDLNERVRASAEMFGRTRKDLIISHSLADDLWGVEADAGQIEHVLINLYINAWHAMSGGGELTVGTANVELTGQAARQLGADPGRYVRVSIVDTGVGMDQETQRRLFEPFFTTREMGRGTGLGLAAAYGIVRNHGGIIDVHSVIDQGTTFTLYFPAREHALGATAVADRARLLQGTETVLLVDDEEFIRTIGERLLRRLGYTVRTATSGREAIDVYARQRDDIDVVILDVVMPGLSGAQTYERLRDINPDVRILLASGYSMPREVQAISQQPDSVFLQKPFTIQHLSVKLRELLGQPPGA